jgi:NADP-dependent 3-hydroxy acid dehydrogenase YdfG
MTKTILVCGLGPGISSAAASRFDGEGLRVGLAAIAQRFWEIDRERSVAAVEIS